MTVTVSGGSTGALQIDERDVFGARVVRHLRDDPVVWMTTVSPRGAPSPNPVWFLWDGASTVLMFSVRDAARVRHLQANPKVSLNFPGDGRGGDIVVISGIAAPQPAGPAADQVPAYLAKYGDRISRMGMTAEAFAEHHSLPIRIALTRLRGPVPLDPDRLKVKG